MFKKIIILFTSFLLFNLGLTAQDYSIEESNIIKTKLKVSVVKGTDKDGYIYNTSRVPGYFNVVNPFNGSIVVEKAKRELNVKGFTTSDIIFFNNTPYLVIKRKEGRWTNYLVRIDRNLEIVGKPLKICAGYHEFKELKYSRGSDEVNYFLTKKYLENERVLLNIKGYDDKSNKLTDLDLDLDIKEINNDTDISFFNYSDGRFFVYIRYNTFEKKNLAQKDVSRNNRLFLVVECVNKLETKLSYID